MKVYVVLSIQGTGTNVAGVYTSLGAAQKSLPDYYFTKRTDGDGFIGVISGTDYFIPNTIHIVEREIIE